MPELVDNAGWDLLVQIAREFGDSDAKKQFKKRLHEEEKHLLFVRETLLELTKKDVSAPQSSPPAEQPRPRGARVRGGCRGARDRAGCA